MPKRRAQVSNGPSSVTSKPSEDTSIKAEIPVKEKNSKKKNKVENKENLENTENVSEVIIEEKNAEVAEEKDVKDMNELMEIEEKPEMEMEEEKKDLFKSKSLPGRQATFVDVERMTDELTQALYNEYKSQTVKALLLSVEKDSHEAMKRGDGQTKVGRTSLAVEKSFGSGNKRKRATIDTNTAVCNELDWSEMYAGHSLGYGEMTRSCLTKALGMLFDGLTNIRFLDIGSGSGRPTLHGAFEFADLVKEAAGVEIGFNRFIVSLEILEYVRDKLRLPLSHISYCQGDAADEKVIALSNYECFFFYDAVVTPKDKRAIFLKLSHLKHPIRLFCCTSPQEMKNTFGIASFVVINRMQTAGQNGKNKFEGYLYELNERSVLDAAEFENQWSLENADEPKSVAEKASKLSKVHKSAEVNSYKTNDKAKVSTAKSSTSPRSNPPSSITAVSNSRNRSVNRKPNIYLASTKFIPPEAGITRISNTRPSENFTVQMHEMLTLPDCLEVSKSLYSLIAPFISDGAGLEFSQPIQVTFGNISLELTPPTLNS